MIIDTIHIKGMVCPRCSKVVDQICDDLGLKVENIKLGEINLREKIGKEKRETLRIALQKEGFEMLDDKRNILINNIKTTLIHLIQNDEAIPDNTNLSNFLSEKFKYDYSYISNLFTATEGRTIEKYLISLRIERVKELLIYNELTLDEIAFTMHYSSTAYLSSQFKRVIGISPSQFRKMNSRDRKSLDEI